ncbi:MAG TPA: CBS domain-containing protein [Steroidobacteraceae bacterium]|nr:CBS domain-containing protein [Steroidobacteraceae bacterium]
MLLKDICTPGVACCKPEVSILEAARQMREAHVGDLVVVDDSEGDEVPLGIITDRDIVVEVLAKELDPTKVKVRTVMRQPVVIASGSEEASKALERMRAHGVRRVPVMGDDRKLMGIVTLDDLVRELAAGARVIADIVSKEQAQERRQRR